MRVVFFTEGGPGIGFGHVSRCSSLEAAFLDQGFDVVLVVSGPPDTTTFFHTPVRHLRDWTTDLPGCHAILESADVAVFDSYRTERLFYLNLLDGFSGIPVFFDDTNRIDYPRGVVVNGALAAAELYPKAGPGVVRLLGASWQPLRPAFQRCGLRMASPKVKRVLLTLGGDDLHELAPRLFDELTSSFPDWLFTFVTTSHSRTRTALVERICPPHQVLIDADAETMAEALMTADLAVTAAGQTTFETARTGLPAVLIQVADNQAVLVKSWLRSGYILQAFPWQRVSVPGTISQALRDLESFEIRAIQARLGQSLVDGLGAARIVAKVKELCREREPA